MSEGWPATIIGIIILIIAFLVFARRAWPDAFRWLGFVPEDSASTTLALLLLVISVLVLPNAYNTIAGQQTTAEKVDQLALAVGVTDVLSEPEIYDTARLQDENLTEVRLLVPVGLTDLRDEHQFRAKIAWIKELQTQTHKDNFTLEAVYGIPPYDSPYFKLVACTLAGFASSAATAVKVFRAWDPPTPPPPDNAAVPGIGVLLATYDEKHKDDNTVLFGAATDPGTVKINAAVTIKRQDVYDRFIAWFDKNVWGEGKGRSVLLPIPGAPETVLKKIQEEALGRELTPSDVEIECSDSNETPGQS